MALANSSAMIVYGDKHVSVALQENGRHDSHISTLRRMQLVIPATRISTGNGALGTIDLPDVAVRVRRVPDVGGRASWRGTMALISGRIVWGREVLVRVINDVQDLRRSGLWGRLGALVSLRGLRDCSYRTTRSSHLSVARRRSVADTSKFDWS